MELLQTILVFLFVLLILVSIHEWGHFIVARWCGVKVQRFSVGFGKPFCRFYDKHGTEFAIAPIPLGGYVKMLDASDEHLLAEDKNKTFDSRKTWQKVAILLAGPGANFILAVLVFWWLAMQTAVLPSPVVGNVEPETPAAYAGMEAGQQILAVDGIATPSRADVYERLTYRLGETGSILLTVKYPGESDLTYDMALSVEKWLRGVEAPNPIEGLGLTFYRPEILMSLRGVVEGSAAEQAGMQAGDKILQTDGQPFESWAAWTDYIKAHPNQAVEVIIERDQKRVTLQATPSSDRDDSGRLIGRLGVYPDQAPWKDEMLITRKLAFMPAFSKAIDDTWSNSVMVLVSVKKLFLGEISTKNLSGPIGIAKVAGDSARAGLQYYLHFMAVLSVYLGVFNLLPIPILDGGRIVFCLAEGLRGQPLSDKIKLMSMQFGLALMAVVMVLAFYNDILRL